MGRCVVPVALGDSTRRAGVVVFDVAEDGQDMLVQERDNNKANEIIGIDETTGPEWVTPEWDARGNMIYGPRPGNEATEAEALLVVYDAWNRPVEFWKDTDESGDLDDPGDTQILECRYDGAGRRIQKTVKGDPDVTFDYYYSGRQVVEIRKDGSEHPYKQYVWGLRYVHSPVCRWYDENADGEGVVQHYYCNDANFNVTALVDTGGNVVERYAYSPYGKVSFFDGNWQPRQSSAYANDILFTGHRLDTETGLYYGGWRYYHPTLGCWIGRETEYRDGLSLYEYVGSNPLVRIDPTGMFWDTPGQAIDKARRAIGKAKKAVEKVGRAVEAVGEKVAQAQEAVREAKDLVEQVVEDVRNFPRDLVVAAIQQVRRKLCEEGIKQMETVDEALRREAEGYEQMAQNLEALGGLAEGISQGTSGSIEPYSTEVGGVAAMYSKATPGSADAMRKLATSARSPETKREYMREICEYLIIPYCCPDEVKKHCAQFVNEGE